jgi:hypothetical protein
MVITVSFHMIDRMEKRITFVDSICKANAITVIDAGERSWINVEGLPETIFVLRRYDHVRPKPKISPVCHPISIDPLPPVPANPTVLKPSIVNGTGRFTEEED